MLVELLMELIEYVEHRAVDGVPAHGQDTWFLGWLERTRKILDFIDNGTQHGRAALIDLHVTCEDLPADHTWDRL
jgi:hypothetical protein